MIELTDAQAQEIIKTGKLPAELTESAEKVALIATQDWCPQWLHMKMWLKSTEKEGVKTYYVCYNRKSYFESFITMKEGQWNNDLVPYVRYYKSGNFIDDSNYVSKISFLAAFDQN
ncbi:MAG: hypothetical protein JEY99_11630 [Spirochaetales bacterium]|nr:hypothetical protein [Spirochaetales bacterium]